MSLEPIVISASALASWLRCRKSFQIQYEWMREPYSTNLAVSLGSAFHGVMEEVADNGWYLKARHEYPNLDIKPWEMAWAYVNNNPPPGPIISAEVPLYTMILPQYGERPAMYLRTTADLVHRPSAKTIRVRDYKTFSREPSIDVDMDTQARLYCTMYMRKYPGENIEFEYEYVRSEIPGTRRLVKKEEYWSVGDCYRRVEVNISKQEADTTFTETQWAFEDIYNTRKTQRYYRTGLKGGTPHTCNTCFIKDICQTEFSQGEITPDQLENLSTKREVLRLPDE